MAIRGSNKAKSVAHEEDIAEWFNGTRSPSSGGADTDDGDVKTENELFECKYTESRSALLGQMEKIADEAFSSGREPVVALRFYAPTSVLADRRGYVDLLVTRAAAKIP